MDVCRVYFIIVVLNFVQQYTNRAMYTNSPTNDSPSGDGTQKAKGRTGPSNQSLTPLTIKQLGNAVQLAPGDVFKVDNKDLNMVCIPIRKPYTFSFTVQRFDFIFFR